jgi:tRNA G18 (ribose-2'-O)-methylase SpoU
MWQIKNAIFVFLRKRKISILTAFLRAKGLKCWNIRWILANAQYRKNPHLHLECILDNVRSSYIVGGNLYRSASAFSIDHLDLCGFTPTPDQAKVLKTSLGAEKQVSWSYERNALSLIQQKKTERSCSIYSIEASLTATSLLNAMEKQSAQLYSCSVFGNEISGVDPEIRRLSDAVLANSYHKGDKKSLRMYSTAFAIAVFYFSMFHQ